MWSIGDLPWPNPNEAEPATTSAVENKTLENKNTDLLSALMCANQEIVKLEKRLERTQNELDNNQRFICKQGAGMVGLLLENKEMIETKQKIATLEQKLAAANLKNEKLIQILSIQEKAIQQFLDTGKMNPKVAYYYREVKSAQAKKRKVQEKQSAPKPEILHTPLTPK